MASDTAERVQGFRRRRRQEGLRPIELWVLDTRHPAVQARLRQDAAIMRARLGSVEEQAVLAERAEAFDALMDELDSGESRPAGPA